MITRAEAIATLKLLTREEAADVLGVSRQTLANWAVDGAGPRFVKIGTNARYRAQDLEAYIEANLVGARED
jgi:excisionase family DNA binding protein